MKKITLKKVNLIEVKALQAGVDLYSNRLQSELNPQMSITFFDNVMQIDILRKVYLMLRTKIESDSSRFSIMLRPSEAVALLFSCQEVQKRTKRLGDGTNTPGEILPFEEIVAEKFKCEIDQQLKSL